MTISRRRRDTRAHFAYTSVSSIVDAMTVLGSNLEILARSDEGRISGDGDALVKLLGDLRRTDLTGDDAAALFEEVAKAAKVIRFWAASRHFPFPYIPKEITAYTKAIENLVSIALGLLDLP